MSGLGLLFVKYIIAVIAVVFGSLVGVTLFILLLAVIAYMFDPKNR